MYLSSDKAVKIASYFHVPLDYVLGKVKKDEYKNAVERAVTQMKDGVDGLNAFVDYLCASTGKKKIKLTEEEKEMLMREIEWYGHVRLLRIIDERGSNDEQKSKQAVKW